ncbi:MAG: adenosylmethionine--8-amino-7-oxononanoate transaminase [Acidobacteria bacterium RIFCSPLOWO2_02_FULL_59_13]|nr:MAG: adenosylmethionine--8-amino-7-oxononanoate transaminase [Acidobacteria bacterium RIFCSPLOWO2_02_FULL_59_13]
MNSADYKQWDHAYLWHPFTQMREWLAEEPLVIERAEGNYLFDSEGNRYFDGVSSLWCNVHGHGRPEIVEVIRRQLDAVAHTTMLGLTNVPATELAKRLIEIAPPGLRRVFYSDSGATAVEIALKMAYEYWQLKGDTGRDLFVSLADSYHGDTIGAMSLGYSELFHRRHKRLLFPCLKISPPHVYRYYRRESPEQALAHAIEDAARTLQENRHRLAALIVEPMMQGAAGMWDHPPEYLSALSRLCRENNILLIADEVAVGFGRTGRMFACEHAGVSPDLMCLGKGITGGYLPLAATLATERIFETFLGDYEEYKTFFHGHTYTGNPLACAAAVASLDVFNKDSLMNRLQGTIKVLSSSLTALRDLPHVADVRHCGLMVGIELAEDVSERRPFPAARRVGKRVALEARKRGVILRPLGDVIVLMPPLSTTEEELRVLVEVAAQSIQAAVKDS